MHTELSACWVLLNLTSTSVATAFLSQYIEDLDACEVVSCGAHVCATHIRARAHTQTHACVNRPPFLQHDIQMRSPNACMHTDSSSCRACPWLLLAAACPSLPLAE